MSDDLKPTPRYAGYIIGGTIGYMPLWQMSGAADEVFATAGVTRQHLFNELNLLLAAAAMHAIETSGLMPEFENEVAQGLYDWMREQPEGTGRFVVSQIEGAVESYALAAQQDKESPAAVGEFCELELELIDRQLALGEDNETRARACVQLGIAAPKALWPAQYASTVQVLRKANLAAIQ